MDSFLLGGGGSCPVYVRMFGSIPDYYLLDACSKYPVYLLPSSLLPSCDNQKYLLTVPNFPGWEEWIGTETVALPLLPSRELMVCTSPGMTTVLLNGFWNPHFWCSLSV